MRCIDLRTTAAIDKPQACNRATLIIGAQDNSPENTIPDDPGYRKICSLTLFFKYEWRLFFGKPGGWLELTYTRQQMSAFLEAHLHNALEILQG